MEVTTLPIRQLSEEAQESRNKDYNKYQLFHSREFPRSVTNEDIFSGFLCTSETYIFSIRSPNVNRIYENDV